MTNVGRQIREGYEAICASRTGEDAIRRYADYHREMLGLPPMEAGQLMEAVDPTININIDDIWSTPTTKGGPYFHGSGAVGVGVIHRGAVKDGRIIAMTSGPLSGTEEDLVLQQYPNYLNYVPGFLGASALLAILLPHEGELGHAAYERYGEVLRETGILKPGKTHHLGNSFRPATNDGRAAFTAGASGVIPHSEVASAFGIDLAEEFKTATQAGLLDWKGDAAAGYHDVVANQLAMNRLEAIPLGTLDFVECVAEARARHALGQDIN